MVVIRKTPGFKSKGSGFAKGRNAVAIDQRTGFKELQREMMFEPGTGYYVKRSESDGKWSLINHPQNYPSPKLKYSERVGLKYPSPDVALSIGIIVSADALGLPSHASTFYTSTGTVASVGTGVSGVAPSVGTGVSDGLMLDFSQINNSQYYIVIYQGI